MSKVEKVYRCSSCGNEVRKWLAMCPRCKEYSTIEEAAVSTGGVGLKTQGAISPTKTRRTISQLNSSKLSRTSTGISELDRVLGGGFVEAEVVLLGGQPGAGKSTLALSIASNLADQGLKILYSSGEESEQQIGLRAQRMKVTNENIEIVNESSLEALLGHLQEARPDFLILDSLQTIASSEISGSVGSISQSKEAAHTLTRYAKNENIKMLLINQIIKSGEFAGSEQVQHIVDCSLMIESDKDTPLKFLRSSKNRFGDTTEVGIFIHSETGLDEVSDPTGILLDDEHSDVYGSSYSLSSEGVRQIPIEVQALVTRSTLPTPRKQFNGINYQRGQIVCAILDKYNRADFFDKDVFVSTVSGVSVNDPIADLAVAAALLSSKTEQKFPSGTVFVGELSLTGYVRGGFMMENKIKEAERLGFSCIVIPETAKKHIKGKFSIKVKTISHIKELNKFLLK